MFCLPKFHAVQQTAASLVSGMIGGVQDDVKADFGKRISHFCRGVKVRIAGESKLIAAKDRFLIDHADICRIKEIADALIKAGIVV